MRQLQTPANEEHLKALGRITSNFVILDNMVEVLLWTLIGVKQPLGQRITNILPFRQKLDLLSLLFEYRNSNDELSDEQQELITRLKDAEDKRNEVTHSSWGASKTPNAITRIKAKARGGKARD